MVSSHRRGSRSTVVGEEACAQVTVYEGMAEVELMVHRRHRCCGKRG